MNILIIGSGAREHAIAWKLAQTKRVTNLTIAPGNAGTRNIATNLLLPDASPDAIASLARQQSADLVVIGPEAPLVAGVADRLRADAIPVIGPSAAAARLEGSKAFSKQFMQRHNIPTARFVVADNPADAIAAVDNFPQPLVVKADGLASGKGVTICTTRNDARAVISQLMEQEALGAAGKRVVLEEFLTGEEVSFMLLADGERFVALPPSQDHKTIYDNDQGPNTGGMGAYCDHRILTPQQRDTILDRIVQPTLHGMAADGAAFQGFLYVGLMMTADGPKVLEYNVRLGDPEAQALLHAMDGDLCALFESASHNALDPSLASWRQDPSVCVVLAAAGYPASPRTGDPIRGIEAAETAGSVVFQAGTKLHDGELLTAGGRVLSNTASAPSLPDAIAKVYHAADLISFDGCQLRRDIGHKGLKRWQS